MRKMISQNLPGLFVDLPSSCQGPQSTWAYRAKRREGYVLPRQDPSQGPNSVKNGVASMQGPCLILPARGPCSKFR